MSLPSDLMKQLETCEWPPQWRSLTDSDGKEADFFIKQLLRELPSRHVLFPYREAVRAIARRDDCDDVLYWVDGAEKPFALVHLTYAPTPEHVPDHPWTVQYPSLREFSEAQAAEFS